MITINTWFSVGTFQIIGGQLIHNVLDLALAAGYRHFDTAVVYRNEEQIGSALKELLPKYKLRRQDIFITSKLIPIASKGPDYVATTVKASLRQLQTDYIDLYLIHWPGVSGIPVTHPENVRYRLETWRKFVELQSSGVIRSIGVSNFTIRHLTELMSSSGVVPSVNQVEWHPHFHQPDLLDFCRKNSIFLQAYSSLGTSNQSDLRNDPRIVAIANKLQRTPSQVLLRWALQQDIGIIPKARSQGHIEENIALNFEIPSMDMDLLSNMMVNEKYAWNPESVV